MMNPSNSFIWKCLEIETASRVGSHFREELEELQGPYHPDEDMISLRDIIGIDIRGDHQAPATLSVKTLDTDSIPLWLNETTNGSSTLRMLVGDRAMRCDNLRPPLNVGGPITGGSHISKSLLAKHFGIPTIAAQRLGQMVAYHASYPPVPGAPSTAACHAIVAMLFSAAWSYDSATGRTAAMLVFDLGDTSRQRRYWLESLETLKEFSRLPALIPFIVLDTQVDLTFATIAENERTSESDDRIIMGNYARRTPFEMFGFAARRLEQITNALKHTKPILQMVQQHQTDQLLRPNGTGDSEWTQMQTYHQSLQQLLNFRRGELEQVVAHGRLMIEKNVSFQSTIMGMLSFNQQETSRSIAEATQKDSKVMKEIAEATKKDSTSMKILALMTMVFLPSTTISTILAIPSMFDFSNNRTNQPLVSSRFWVFFAVAIPLTALTMALTWCWLRWETNGRSLSWLTLKRKSPTTKVVVDPNKIV